MENGRVRTFVQGFDEILEGGIPAGHMVLVSGEPGTMKTSLAYSILHHNAREEGMTGVYLSLEQGRGTLCAHLRGMGLDPDEVEDLVSIVDLGVIRCGMKERELGPWMDIIKTYIANLGDTNGCDLLVLDSLPILSIVARLRSPREELYELFEWLRSRNATCFLVSEMKPGSAEYGRYGEDFLVDGIFHLKMERVDDINIQRRIRCVKMRGTRHGPNYYTLMFHEGRFQATQVLAE
jgi:KaiC/GvpD/RAD55 family RecA-like ATPase